MTKAKKALEEQRARVKADEEEMMTKKKELNQIRSEESSLQSKLACYRKEMEQLSASSGQIQLQISQVKALLVTLEEYEGRLKEGSADLEAAVAANEYHKLTTLLARPITPPPEMQTVSHPPPANDCLVTSRDAVTRSPRSGSFPCQGTPEP